ncbi:hypothetical protein [Desulfocicer niacini]
MFAGLWGIKDVSKIKNEFLKKFDILKYNDAEYGEDENFLDNIIYPLIKNEILVHDIKSDVFIGNDGRYVAGPC